MTTKKLLLITIAAILTAGGITVATLKAAQTDRFEPGFRQHLRERIVERLAVTPEQQAAIRTELRSEKETIVFLAKSLVAAKKNLKTVIQQKDATEALVRAAAAQVAEVQAEIAVERYRISRKVRPHLTPEQVEKIQAFEKRAGGFVETLLERLGQRLEQ